MAMFIVIQLSANYSSTKRKVLKTMKCNRILYGFTEAAVAFRVKKFLN